MKKQSITLEMIFNRMDEMYADFLNKFEELKEKLTCPENVLQDSESRLENVQNDIPNTEYVTITADDVLVGGEPTRQYHGQDLYNYYHLTAYFKDVRDIVREEYGCELLEIHCLQSSTNGEYAKPGNPIADKKGVYEWCRVVYLDKNNNKTTSLWVFGSSASSAGECAGLWASNCGYNARYYSSLRAGFFGSVRQ